MSKTLAVISLGCDKNRVDTERMLYKLTGRGYTVCPELADADIALINTCAFIESAREEAIDAILSVAEYKKTGRLKTLIVAGCLVQNHMAELKESLPEVDAFLNVGDYDGVLTALGEPPATASTPAFNRVLTTPPHYAYLRVSDGCDNRCTFCSIPGIRGRYRSESLDILTAEAGELVSRGAKELILVGQDVTNYGKDIGGESLLPTLIDRLSVTDAEWIRLLYCYPERVTDALIERLKSNTKLCRYLDIPMQHADDTVLRRMNRQSTYASLSALFEKLRKADEGIEIRTTFMVGFPGETDASFETLLRFVRENAVKTAGVFAFCPEEGTPAAKLSDQVPEDVKQARYAALYEEIARISKRENRRAVGKTLRVLYEDIDYERELFKGRTEGQAPEIDGAVYFKGTYAEVGSFYDVKITDCDEYDLIGEME